MADQNLPPVETDTLKPLGEATSAPTAIPNQTGLPPVEQDSLKPLGGEPTKAPPSSGQEKAGFDLGTASAMGDAAAEGVIGVAKGTVQLPYQIATHHLDEET